VEAEEITNRFIGPPLAGALIALSVVLPFWIFAACMALSLAFVARLTLSTAAPDRALFLRPLKEGLRYLMGHTPLRRLALVLGASNFLGAMSSVILLLYAQDILGLGALAFGALFAGQALGALLGSAIGPWLVRHLGPSRCLPFSMIGLMALSLGLASGAPIGLIAGLLVLDGFTGMMWNIVTVSYCQRTIPAALFTPVNAAYRFFGSGALPLGALAGGSLVSLAAPLGSMSLHLPYAFVSAGGALMMGYSLRFLLIE
jgi:hypothetical protein